MNDYFKSIGFWSEGAGIGGYLIGFLTSLLLTGAAYLLATHHALGSMLPAALVTLALIQFLVQAAFFLHLGEKGASKERLAIFAGACVVVFILVAGSLWIMFTLNARMGTMDPGQMLEYMQNESGF